jgi:NIMA (never in mitosis gene a)-related kinase
MPLSDFKVLSKLGDGALSCVYKVKRKEDGLEYAMKRVKIAKLTDREKANAINEVRILASVKNPFIASYKESFMDEISNSLYIVMEMADDGDLYERICDYKDKKCYMPERTIWKVLI